VAVPLILFGVVLLAAAITALAIAPIERIAFVAVGAFVLFITWNGLRLAGGALANVFMVLAFAAVIGQTLLARRPIPLPPWLLAAGAGCVLAAMVNAIFPPHPDWLAQSLMTYRTDFQPPSLIFMVPRSDLATLVKFEAALVLIPMLIASVATTAARIERLIDLFAVSATVNATVGIVDLAGFHIAPQPGGTGRDSGLTIHPNYLALTCTVGIPLALLWVSRGGRWRVAGLVATALLLGGEYVSGSRAGAVSALLAIIVTVAAIPSLRGALGFVLPAVGLALVPLLVLTRFGHQVLAQVRFHSDTTSGSNSARSDLADLAFRQITARPIQGVGFGVIEDAHSIYLQILAAGGVIGMAAFLTFLGGLWSAVRVAFRGPLRDAAAASGTSVLVWLTNGIFDAQLADKYLYVVPGLLLAMSCVASAPARAREREAPSVTSIVAPARPSLA
jgi:O-antigen ligase